MEKLTPLLSEQHESEALDFKATLNLSERRDIVELAKDVGAMCARGGYIVIGAEEDGPPSGMLDETHARLSDAATLRPRMLTYLSEPLDLRCARHQIGGNRLAVTSPRVYTGFLETDARIRAADP